MESHDTSKSSVTINSRGGRLYVRPTDILASAKVQQMLERFRRSSIYEDIKNREHKPSSAA